MAPEGSSGDRASGARSLSAMEVTSKVPEMPVGDIRRAIAGFPHPDGYDLRVIPLRYRGDKPHLSAWTDFEEKAITIQIPEPFLPFGEIVPYRRQAPPGQGDAVHLAHRGRHVPQRRARSCASSTCTSGCTGT